MITAAQAQLILEQDIFPPLVEAATLLPADATAGLGTLTIADIQSRLSQHLDPNPLDARLRHLAESATASGVTVTFQHIGPDLDLNPTTTAELALICQELLNNALKHAGATAVQILLVTTPSLMITLADNGRGLSPSQQLDELESRLNSLAGTLTQKNRSEGGAAFVLSLPGQEDSSPHQKSPERTLGQQLHDGICQELAILKMMATHLRDTTDDPTLWKRYRDATQSITTAWEKTRDLSHQLLGRSSKEARPAN